MEIIVNNFVLADFGLIYHDALMNSSSSEYDDALATIKQIFLSSITSLSDENDLTMSDLNVTIKSLESSDRKRRSNIQKT